MLIKIASEGGPSARASRAVLLGKKNEEKENFQALAGWLGRLGKGQGGAKGGEGEGGGRREGEERGWKVAAAVATTC